MKFSEAWLREYVNPELTTRQLVDQLTMAGLEVDGFEPVASKFSKVVVGEILNVESHPDADKLVVCRVSSGAEEHQVVCGAPNARAGIKIPFALIGAKLEDFKIKKAKLRGVESFGMLCSERELGLSDRHEGLMELPNDAPVGDDIREYLKLDDAIIDLDLTPNRSDCLGMVGLGRETGLINALDVQMPDIGTVAASINDQFPVELNAGEACPRFAGRVIKGIRLDAETPLWMKEKLRRSEVRSIDPVVDVTNYVMLELGQPMHAYDLGKLSGKIAVRQSVKGEKVTLLDESEVDLDGETLLITDDSGPIGIAGIMGGLSTSVTASTTDIFLESAFFSPAAITGRARSYAMNTDASHRFERGVDWQGQSMAVERATELLLQISGGEAGPTVETVLQQALPQDPNVSLRLNRVKKLLGVEIEANQVDDILTRLGFEHSQSVTAEDTVWQVQSPSHRFDIAIEADLIEEISRVYGYNNLPVRTPRTSLSMAPIPDGELLLNRIKDQLVSRGYYEAITYSFVDPAIQAVLDPESEPIGLANPLSSEMAEMRTTLWSGLVKSLIYNINRQQSRVRLFESGLRFLQSPNKPELEMSDIRQERMLAGVVFGKRQPESWANSTQAVDFFDIKGDVESVLNLTGAIEEFEFSKGHHPALHPGQTAQISRNGNLVGYLGLMDPRTQKSLAIEQNVYLFELKLDEITSRRVPEADRLSKFPEVRRDIAVIVDNGVSAAEINACVRSVAKTAFKNLMLFDVYQGKGIDPNRKSVALGLTFQHPSRTLTDAEINEFIDEIVDVLANNLGATLRN
ncbi:MAG TPA: phenylalanine--tRNA ligase subunit beta [Gammaproteobacteria bacterium]|nr:phenylalanine--tRNA ligase subunit beta [Gammaproteobacteria bacterium]